MKILIIFILYFAIPHYLFSQEGQLENPYYNIKIINQSILYFKTSCYYTMIYAIIIRILYFSNGQGCPWFHTAAMF